MSESVQWTMLTPLLLTLVLGIIQLGLWGYGRTVVVNAAGAAAEAAAPQNGSAGIGVDVGTAVASRGGLVEVEVNVDESADVVVAHVSGRMPGLIDVGLTQVAAQATRPKERVTGP